jgi:hypothetical protein
LGRRAAAALLVLLASAAGAFAQTVTITATAGPGGTITPSGAVELPVGSNLTLTLTPDTGFYVKKIVVDGHSVPIGSDYTFENITKSHKIAAKFKANVYTVTASAIDGFKIKPSGSLQLAFGKVKTFKIKPPSPGAVPYVTVDGDPVAPTAAGNIWTLALTVTGNHAIEVSSAPADVTVTVDRTGTGTGVVTGAPGGIDCGAVCGTSVPPGTDVTLTAAADSGSVFVEWSGACTGTDPVCLFTASASVTATARFDLVTEEEGFTAIPSAEPPSGKAPLAVSLVPDADGSTDPIAFYAWDDDGDGTWDSCDPDDPGNPAAPCDTEGVPRDHLYPAIGQYAPALLVQTTTGDRAIGTTLVDARGTTSEEKIQDALEAGSIDDETALQYQVFADFGDARLPAEFAGDDPGPGAESTVMRELSARFDTLPPATQDLLAPFLMPPAYTGSWYSVRMSGAKPAPHSALQPNGRPACSTLDPGWMSYPSGTAVSVVRVWWDNANSPGNAAAASHLFNEINSVIWPRLATLMGRTPLNDEIAASNGCFGGDGLLDLYLVTGTTRSGEETIGDCRIAEPGFIVARPNIEDGTTAHEVFHAFQDAFTLGECSANDPYRWYAEASAQWAMNHVYHTPKGNKGLEQGPAPDYLRTTSLSLDKRTGTNREYGAYVFPFYLAESYSPSLIRDSWQRMELDLEPPIEALDHVISGGFEARWPEFARRAWNRRPYHEFWKWDRLSTHATAQSVTDVQMSGQPTVEYTMPVSLPRVSIMYYHYKFPDDTARTMTFVNGLTKKATKGPLPNGLDIYGDGYAVEDLAPADKKGGSVQVLLKIDGAWQTPLDLTDVPHYTWCRDTRATRIEEAVFILANSDTQQGRILKETGQPTTLFVTNIGCHEWTGDAHFTSPEDGSVKTELYLYDLKFTRFGPPISSPFAPSLVTLFPLVTPFRLTEGSLTLIVSGTDTNGCTYDGQVAALPLPDGRTDTPLTLNLFTGLYGGVAYHSLQLSIVRIPTYTYPVTVCCPDAFNALSCSIQDRLFNTLLFYEPLVSLGNPLLPAGNRIEGTEQELIAFPDATGTWSLDAQREP